MLHQALAFDARTAHQELFMSQDPVTPQDAAGEASTNANASPADGTQAQTQNGEASNAAPLTLEQQLQQAEAKASEHHDAWLRAKAETENMRKRALLDVASAHKYAVEGMASELLPVRDSLEATLAAEKVDLDTLRSGVELTLKQLVAAFDKVQIKPINPQGEKFDPHRHQAISMLPSEQEANTVLTVLQTGYQLQERVVRPALVTVSKGPDKA
jgi:molecular chaperone GrpE